MVRGKCAINMQAFVLPNLVAEQQQSGGRYHEFLKVSSLSAGIYLLPAGGIDPQKPHTEDEVYYVISGRASIQVGTENRRVEPGSLVFVEAEVEHRFHTILEDLVVLVFFAPAEGSRPPGFKAS
jgi:mannose-6-phosphate isomerase-like protein (cupin superfamily)